MRSMMGEMRDHRAPTEDLPGGPSPIPPLTRRAPFISLLAQGEDAPAPIRLHMKSGPKRGLLAYIPLALSVTTDVQAPSGFLVMTGSEPPFISVSTVRSAAATSSEPSEPSVSLLISSIIVA